MTEASLDAFLKRFLRAFYAYGNPQGFPEEAAHADLASLFVDFADSGLDSKELQTQLTQIAELSSLEEYYGHIPVGFRSFGRLDDARTWLQQTKSAFTDWAPVNLASLAMDYLEAEDKDNARATADEAEKTLSGKPLPQLTDADLVVYTEAMARIFLALDDLKKAEEYTRDRVELAENDDMRDALWLRAEVLRAQGETERAQEAQEQADAIADRLQNEATLRSRSRLDDAAHVLAHHYVDVITPGVDASASKQSTQVFTALHDVAGSNLSTDELRGFGERVSGVLRSHIQLQLTDDHAVDIRLLLPSSFVRKGYDGGLSLMSAEAFALGLPYYSGFVFALAARALLNSEDRGAAEQLPQAVDRAIVEWNKDDQVHDDRLDQPASAALATALVALERFDEAERWTAAAMVGLGNPLQFVPDDEVRRARLDVLRHLGTNEDEQEALRRGMAQGAGAGRNDPCPCGSGKKYKHCCGRAAA